MDVRKLEVDPVSNRRAIFLLALTAGICFAVFVGISLEFSVLPAHGNKSTCKKLQQKVSSASFDAGQLAFLDLEGRIFSLVFAEISLLNTTTKWIPAGFSFSMFLFQSSFISLSIWLLGYSNCRPWFWNRFQSLSASSASTTTRSARKIEFKFNFFDPDVFLARLLKGGTTFLLLGTLTSASNRCGLELQGDNKPASTTSALLSNCNKMDFGQPASFSKVRALKSSPILDDVSATINTGSSQSTTSEETQSTSK
jgi:hypothetical protein